MLNSSDCKTDTQLDTKVPRSGCISSGCWSRAKIVIHDLLTVSGLSSLLLTIRALSLVHWSWQLMQQNQIKPYIRLRNTAVIKPNYVWGRNNKRELPKQQNQHQEWKALKSQLYFLTGNWVQKITKYVSNAFLKPCFMIVIQGFIVHFNHIQMYLLNGIAIIFVYSLVT